MSVKKSVLLVVLAVVGFINYGFAQSLPILDQNPTGLKWYQINTPKFRVVYPKGFESEAQRMANTLETIYGPVSRSLEKEPRPISIVLQNQTAISNGLLPLLPAAANFLRYPLKIIICWAPTTGLICWQCMSSGMWYNLIKP